MEIIEQTGVYGLGAIDEACAELRYRKRLAAEAETAYRAVLEHCLDTYSATELRQQPGITPVAAGADSDVIDADACASVLTRAREAVRVMAAWPRLPGAVRAGLRELAELMAVPTKLRRGNRATLRVTP